MLLYFARLRCPLPAGIEIKCYLNALRLRNVDCGRMCLSEAPMCYDSCVKNMFAMASVEINCYLHALRFRNVYYGRIWLSEALMC